MLWNVLLALASLVLLCADMALGTRELECPRGWMADGVTRSGVTGCRMAYGCEDRRTVRGGWTSECQGSYELTRRLWCNDDERPVVDLRGIVRCAPALADGP